ncbi:nose resistant to fluoxetine protein 6 [Nephila pilipes]|uniref:Nose resistant to fluoxetine protein 6 n=1 Tax=Nephila pilipes TaxID=299642 RepID=A0A8X6QIR8_NEPPI|nr:nose resistant to fluoxetine protein 6 [Nephila pilipes]
MFLLCLCASVVVFCRAENTTNFDSNSLETMNNTLNTTLPTDNVFEKVTEISTEVFTESTTAEVTTPNAEATTLSVLQKWQKLEKVTKLFAKTSIKNLMANLMDNTGDLNISTSCRREVLKLLIGLREIKTWAFSPHSRSSVLKEYRFLSVITFYSL